MLNEMHLTVQEETIDKYAFWVRFNLDIFFGATSQKRKSHPKWDGFFLLPACRTSLDRPPGYESRFAMPTPEKGNTVQGGKLTPFCKFGKI